MDDSNANAKAPADTAASAEGEQNPTNSPPNGGDGADNLSRRTPFTNLSQVDADLALARTLQEQERAYMMLAMGGGDGIPYGSWGDDSYGHENAIYDDDYDDAGEEDYDGSGVEVDDDESEDAFDVHARGEGVEDDNHPAEMDPASFSSDEAFARALQDAEEREMAARMLALSGINEMVVGDDEDVDEDEDEDEQAGILPDTWDEVDPDELSYEELIALGEVVGTESRGLSADTIASLASVNYKSQDTQEGISDSCVICRLDYEDGDALTVLSCKHLYHPECINNWLQINKVCPVCSTEVSNSSGKS
ncbi:E3 ubiquitin ligase BIG BROTHER-related-like [Salvia hispanica]|uniref:E3 ubiquitin ligase BIG BROTHER-related-like n=1 Tax=Salvia hispanica TaxID=49212 RepID=UPI00200970C1|nr:E3 ubiquitin ligase BIG BROTHER-related-like [Salvia hispanica]